MPMIYSSFLVTMARNLAILIAIALPGTAGACQCSFPPLDTAHVRAAKTVFVFRLIGAELQPKGNSGFEASTVVGKIQVLHTLRGATTATRIRYSNFWCCGTRLEVGRSYFAFVSEEGAELAINSGNVLQEDESGHEDNPWVRKRIEEVLNGSRTLDSALPASWQGQTLLPPPPPPPPSCPPKAKRHR